MWSVEGVSQQWKLACQLWKGSSIGTAAISRQVPWQLSTVATAISSVEMVMASIYSGNCHVNGRKFHGTVDWHFLDSGYCQGMSPVVTIVERWQSRLFWECRCHINIGYYRGASADRGTLGRGEEPLARAVVRKSDWLFCTIVFPPSLTVMSTSWGLRKSPLDEGAVFDERRFMVRLPSLFRPSPCVGTVIQPLRMNMRAFPTAPRHISCSDCRWMAYPSSSIWKEKQTLNLISNLGCRTNSWRFSP